MFGTLVHHLFATHAVICGGRPGRYCREVDYLPEFEGAYLEDSYLTGIVAEGRDLRLRMLFALTIDHPAYAPPAAGEAHCLRGGSILIERPDVIAWRPGITTLSRDLDETFDFGGLDLYREGATLFRFVTEWFDATMDTRRVSLTVD